MLREKECMPALEGKGVISNHKIFPFERFTGMRGAFWINFQIKMETPKKMTIIRRKENLSSVVGDNFRKSVVYFEMRCRTPFIHPVKDKIRKPLPTPIWVISLAS